MISSMFIFFTNLNSLFHEHVFRVKKTFYQIVKSHHSLIYLRVRDTCNAPLI